MDILAVVQEHAIESALTVLVVGILQGAVLARGVRNRFPKLKRHTRTVSAIFLILLTISAAINVVKFANPEKYEFVMPDNFTGETLAWALYASRAVRNIRKTVTESMIITDDARLPSSPISENTAHAKVSPVKLSGITNSYFSGFANFTTFIAALMVSNMRNIAETVLVCRFSFGNLFRTPRARTAPCKIPTTRTVSADSIACSCTTARMSMY